MPTGYLSAILLSAAILCTLPYSGENVATRQLERRLLDSDTFRESLQSQCSILKPSQDNRIEKHVIEILPLAENLSKGPCLIRIQTEKTTRFQLLEFWHFLVVVSRESLEPVTPPIHWSSEFPRPLCLLPLIIFFLSIPFRVPKFGIGITSALYLLLLGGFSPIQSLRLVWEAIGSTMETDNSVLGLISIALWYALYVARYAKRTSLPIPNLARYRRLNHVITGIIGLANPAFYTLLAPILSPWAKRMGRIRSFFSFQTALLAISLYLLVINPKFPREIIESSLTLPRYFTFALLLFLFLSDSFRSKNEARPIWTLPKFKSITFMILAMESAAYFFEWPKLLPRASRIGIALLLTEIFDFSTIHLPTFFEATQKTVVAVFLSSFLTTLSIQTGITEMVTLLWEPSARSTAITVLTFIGGIGVGFVTGNFSATFFALTPLVMKFQNAPLLRAALLDGILAGILLSPFSLFNLVPAAHYGIRLTNLMLLRIRQLSVPLLIAFIIYGLGSIRTVGILRPVTFVFLCLLVFALKLKQVNFSWDQLWKAAEEKPKTA